MAERPTIFEYLTQEEWKTCFALVFAADTEFGEDINLSEYHAEGFEDTWESGIMAAVRFLALEHDFPFTVLRVREEDREFECSQTHPICPQNRLYLHSLGLGKLPDVPLALTTAIKVLHERAPGFNTEALEHLRAEVEEHVRQVVAHTDIEELDRAEKVIDGALASVGVVRLPVH